jgi:hypothetical protein
MYLRRRSIYTYFSLSVKTVKTSIIGVVDISSVCLVYKIICYLQPVLTFPQSVVQHQ